MERGKRCVHPVLVLQQSSSTRLVGLGICDRGRPSLAESATGRVPRAEGCWSILKRFFKKVWEDRVRSLHRQPEKKGELILESDPRAKRFLRMLFCTSSK